MKKRLIRPLDAIEVIVEYESFLNLVFPAIQQKSYDRRNAQKLLSTRQN